MTQFELLEQKAKDNHILLLSAELPICIHGYYYSSSEFNTISINKYLDTTHERCCVLAEELGHHFTTPIDLFKTSKVNQDKYEHCAVVWAVNELIPLQKLIDAWHDGIRTSWELADYLDVTESFLRLALKVHEEKHGPITRCNKHVIRFCSLKIKEVISE